MTKPVRIECPVNRISKKKMRSRLIKSKPRQQSSVSAFLPALSLVFHSFIYNSAWTRTGKNTKPNFLLVGTLLYKTDGLATMRLTDV